MTELQSQQAEPEVTQEAPEQEQHQQDAPQTAPESTAVIDGPESATGSAEEREESTGEPNQEQKAEETPDSVQRRINKIHWEKMEAKREADRLRKELEDAKKSSEPQLEIKDVPAIPDVWDEDYESKIKARDAIIANNVKAEAIQEAETRAQKADLAKQEQEAYERQVKLQGDFNDRAQKSGINEQSLLEAQKLLVSNGLNGEKAYAVLTDDNGPQVAMYLAENPHELQTILSMDTITAVRHIDRQISAKLAPSQSTSTAPPPPETLNGKGATTRDWFKEKHPNAVIE